MSFSTIIDAGFIPTIQNQAIQTIKKERDRYDIVWKTIEEYCIKHSLIISNKYILSDLTDSKKNICDKIYRIYTSNPFRHANNLTNDIYKKMIADSERRFTRLKTVKENEEFLIEYDMRQMVQIYKVQKHKSGEPTEVIKPVSINNILYMPSELELIDIYHTLYDPNQFKDYNEAFEFEEILFQQVSKRKEHGIIGGSCRIKKRQMLEALKIGIVSEWLPKQDDIILIGPWAHDWIKSQKDLCVNVEKIQIIGLITPDKLKHKLQAYTRTLTKFDISIREQQLHIPKDFRTIRFTFYIHINTERGIIEKPFLDLFNCAEFEIIPCVKINNILIGTKWVILRFLFIDLWVVRVIKNMGLLSGDILNKKLVYLWGIIEFFRMEYTMSDQNKKFIGVHRDSNMDKKISNLEGRTFYPYYPETYFKQNKKYREI